MEDETVSLTSPTVQLSDELKAGFVKKDLVQQLISEEL